MKVFDTLIQAGGPNAKKKLERRDESKTQCNGSLDREKRRESTNFKGAAFVLYELEEDGFKQSEIHLERALVQG